MEDKLRAGVNNITVREVLAYCERHYNILKASMLEPTFDKVVAICSKDFSTQKALKDLEELESKIEPLQSDNLKNDITEEINALKIKCYYILPDDFVLAVVKYALSINKTDIKKVTEEMLLSAAQLAKLGNDNPADHIHGEFTHFNKDDINRRAWDLYYRELNKNGD
jgi:cysteinyl-tRNA synthetase